MGYNARNDEIRDNIVRMQREWEAHRDALATVRRFNAQLSAKGYVWFWPKIVAALASKHHWLVIARDSCETFVDLDLRVRPRDPEASVRVALRDVRCPRCNGHGRPRNQFRNIVQPQWTQQQKQDGTLGPRRTSNALSRSTWKRSWFQRICLRICSQAS
jgi:hypothetical protein